MARCPSNLHFPPMIVTIISFIGGACMIAAGVLGFVNFLPLRIAVNLYLIVFGIFVILADIRAFPIFGYTKFVYSPVGRGLFFLLGGAASVSGALLDIVFGCIIFFVGIVFGISAHLNGGVPKPLTQRSVDELPLTTELRFVEPQGV